MYLHAFALHDALPICFLRGLFLLIGVFGLLPRAQALQVGDIQVAEQVSVDSYLLTLHGAGMYKRFFFDRYVAALYTTTKGLDTATIVNSSEPRSLRLTLARKIGRASCRERGCQYV